METDRFFAEQFFNILFLLNAHHRPGWLLLCNRQAAPFVDAVCEKNV